MPQVSVEKGLSLAEKNGSDSTGCYMVTLHTILSDSWEGSTRSISERFQESKDYTCKLIEFVFVFFFSEDHAIASV